MNVLIVEADPANSSILRQLLKERAYDVTACATVAEAMKVFRETVFQLLFVDLCLPGRDGFSFCRWVRDQAAGDQPVILANTTSDRPADYGRFSKPERTTTSSSRARKSCSMSA
jgi:DNA-binding response OmpR family regulator